MTILCPCGQRMHDGRDNQAFQAWLFPDQERIDAEHDIDHAIDEVAAGRLDKETAHMTWRVPFYLRTRVMYQCKLCGRIAIDDKDRKLHWFAPDCPDTPREIFRRREDDAIS